MTTDRETKEKEEKLAVKNYKSLLSAFLLTPLLAFLHPPSLLVLLLVLPFALAIYGITSSLNFSLKSSITQKGHKNLNFILNYLALIIYWFLGLFSLALMLLQTKNGFPWSQYLNWEKTMQFPLENELIGALGILFPFSLIGIYKTIKSKKFAYIFITCWLMVPLFFIPLSPKLNLSNIRLIQGLPYLPLSVLAVLGIETIEKKIKNFYLIFPPQRLIKTDFPNLKLPLSHLFFYLSLFLFFSFTLPVLHFSINDQIREYWPIFGNVYLDKRLKNAFDFINQNYPPKTIVLSTFYTGNYLPSFTHAKSFIGHFGYTYNLEEKQKKTQRFFEGKMTEEEVKDFLISNKILLIWQGPEEKPLYKNYLYPSRLKPVFDREEVTLYVLRNN